MKKIIFATLSLIVLISCVSTPSQRSTASLDEERTEREFDKYPKIKR